MFYTHSIISVTGLPAAFVHNLVSNASASGISLLASSLVGRVFVQQATNTMTGFPIITDLVSNTMTIALSMNAAAATSYRVEVQFMHNIPT